MGVHSYDSRVPQGSKRRSALPASLRFGLIALLAGVLALLGLALVGVIPTFRSMTVDHSQAPILQQLQRVNVFKAATGTFDVVVDIEKKTDGLPSWLSGKRAVMIATGSVDAEVDFTGLKGDAIKASADRKSVTVTLPPPNLSDVDLDMEKTRILDVSQGILDKLGSLGSPDTAQFEELYRVADKKIAKTASKSYLEATARDNTKGMLESMLGALGYEKVTVVFDESAPTPTTTPTNPETGEEEGSSTSDKAPVTSPPTITGDSTPPTTETSPG